MCVSVQLSHLHRGVRVCVCVRVYVRARLSVYLPLNRNSHHPVKPIHRDLMSNFAVVGTHGRHYTQSIARFKALFVRLWVKGLEKR